MQDQSRKYVDLDVYRPPPPQGSGYFQCVQDNFEKLQNVWDDRYASRCGYWRPYVMDVIYRYLECGDLHFGFARVRCDHCGLEYLRAYSCKRRHFCPSCHQKRVVEYGEWLLSNVLKNVPHRQWVFSILKRLRASDRNKSTILLVFVPVYGVITVGTYSLDMHRQLCLVDGHESGPILVDLFLSEALKLLT